MAEPGELAGWERDPPGTPLPAPSLGCVPCPTRFNAEEVYTCPQTSVPEQFASVPWNSFSRDMLKAVYGFAPISVHCNKSTAVRFPVRKPRRGLAPLHPGPHRGPQRGVTGSAPRRAPAKQLERSGGGRRGPRQTDGLQRRGLMAPPGRVATVPWATAHHGAPVGGVSAVSGGRQRPQSLKIKRRGRGR